MTSSRKRGAARFVELASAVLNGLISVALDAYALALLIGVADPFGGMEKWASVVLAVAASAACSVLARLQNEGFGGTGRL